MAFWDVTPIWFAGYDAIIELTFALIALAIGLFALRIYWVTSQRSTKLIGSGFILISFAYFIQSLLDFVSLPWFIEIFSPIVNIHSTPLLETFAAYAHMAFLLSGFIVLFYMTLIPKDRKALIAMLFFGVLTLFLNPNPFFTFYLLSIFCVAFTAWHFIKNYFKRQQMLSLLIAIAFLLIFVGRVPFLLAGSLLPESQAQFYIIGHIIELVAYAFLLINFYLVLRK